MLHSVSLLVDFFVLRYVFRLNEAEAPLTAYGPSSVAGRDFS